MIESKTIAGEFDEPHLLITAGVHGDEFAPMAAVRRLAGILKPESLAGRVTLAPVVNAAAFRLGRRCAEDGLDLARVCPGNEDGSVTERTAHALAALIRQADFYIDLHTGGTTLSLLPLAGYVLHPDPLTLQTQRAMARVFNLPVMWGTSPAAQGRSLSVARDANVPAIYAEYFGGAAWDAGCVEAYVEGCLNVIAALGIIERELPSSRVSYVVEDSREGSGHLQVCHPSPCAGFFEPSVALGQQVEEGEILGRVVDALADQTAEIRADRSGIVLGLRIFSAVSAGDALAVVLEPEQR